MEFIKDLLWNISFTGNYWKLTLEILTFLGFWALLLYAIYFIISKAIKPKQQRETQLQMQFLWALAVLQLVCIVYLFFLFRYEDVSVLRWNETSFYPAFAPQLIVFIGGIILFVVSYQRYNKKHQL